MCQLPLMVLADDEKAILKSFELFPSVDGVMIANIDFNLYDAIGFGGISSKKGYAYVNIKIFDKQGKRIFKLKERASSSDGGTCRWRFCNGY